MAVGAPAGSIIGRNLNLIVGPDDKVLQEQTGLVWVSDVFHLTINWKPWQAVPGSTGNYWSTVGGREKTAQRHKCKHTGTQIQGRNRGSDSSMGEKRELTIDEVRGRYLIGTNYTSAAVSDNEAKWRGRKRADTYYHVWMTLTQTGTYHWGKNETGCHSSLTWWCSPGVDRSDGSQGVAAIGSWSTDWFGH